VYPPEYLGTEISGEVLG